MAFSRDTNKKKINFIIELSLYQQHTLAGSRASKHGRARDLFGRRRPLASRSIALPTQLRHLRY